MKFVLRAAALVVHNNKVLLVKHRHGNDAYWVLPGGRVEEGETILQAAGRELAEELNIKPEIQKMLFFDEVILPERRKHVVDFVYLAKAKTAHFKVNVAEAVVDARYFSFPELTKLDLRPPVAKLLLALNRNNFKAKEFFAGTFIENK